MIGRLSPNQPEYIIQLMDIIRASGNSSAHDGLKTDESIRELNDNENRERVITLFKFLNLICELIGLSNQSNKMFSSELTEGQRKQIKIRNQKNKKRLKYQHFQSFLFFDSNCSNLIFKIILKSLDQNHKLKYQTKV
ncbi:putative uncharacterized protein [Lactobacillus amylovorus CAG:719]|nr:putative uncharacterized protein [Lactobacillus amylovorus CAG:719]